MNLMRGVSPTTVLVVVNQWDAPDTVIEVAPASKTAYPIALRTLRVNQCESSFISLWRNMPRARTTPTGKIPLVYENMRQTGNRIHRSKRALAVEMRPVGIGRQGLLRESSPGERL